MAVKKPNILILWGDDIGYWNISAYNLGQMGYRTPNLDRLAKEGALFTDGAVLRLGVMLERVAPLPAVEAKRRAELRSKRAVRRVLLGAYP